MFSCRMFDSGETIHNIRLNYCWLSYSKLEMLKFLNEKCWMRKFSATEEMRVNSCFYSDFLLAGKDQVLEDEWQKVMRSDVELKFQKKTPRHTSYVKKNVKKMSCACSHDKKLKLYLEGKQQERNWFHKRAGQTKKRMIKVTCREKMFAIHGFGDFFQFWNAWCYPVRYFLSLVSKKI